MGTAFLYGNGGSGGGAPVIESVKLRKKSITIESDTVLKENAQPSDFSVSIDSNQISISSVTIDGKLKATCTYNGSYNVGNHTVSAKILSNAFKYKKPGSKLSVVTTKLIGNLYKVSGLPQQQLSVSRYGLAATTTGNYAFFVGGEYRYGYYSAAVDVYDNNLSRSTATQSKSSYVVATTVGKYALFADRSLVVCAYDSSSSNLKLETRSDFSVARCDMAVTTVGNYAIFGGGYVDTATNAVDVYDSNLNHTIPKELLSVARYNLKATAVGNYALFAGGSRGYQEYQNVVDVYGTDLERTATKQPLSYGRANPYATTVGNYALFAGGNSTYNVIDIFDNELSRVAVLSDSTSLYSCCPITLESYAIFCAGNSMLVYDEDLIKIDIDALDDMGILSTARYQFAGATVGNYALFAGGYLSYNNATNATNAVDVYSIK